MINDYCEFFKKIEADPSKKVSGITIGEYIKARRHLLHCPECSDRVDRVLDKAPRHSVVDEFTEN